MNLFDFVRTISRIDFLETKGGTPEGLTEKEVDELGAIYSIEISVTYPEVIDENLAEELLGDFDHGKV